MRASERMVRIIIEESEGRETSQLTLLWPRRSDGEYEAWSLPIPNERAESLQRKLKEEEPTTP